MTFEINKVYLRRKQDPFTNISYFTGKHATSSNFVDLKTL